MQSNPESNMDLSELMRLAQSPMGQQLLAMLRQNNPSALQAAMSSALQGDYEQAKKSISACLEDPQAQAILKQLGGSK